MLRRVDAQEAYGMECHISGRPFTVFRWRPGQDARCVRVRAASKRRRCAERQPVSRRSFKKTVICREVALAKYVCQVRVPRRAARAQARGR